MKPGNYSGRNLHFGVREHAMGAIVNGMSLSKLRAYGSTFLIFSDYMRAPIRLASLMEIPVIHIFTHDSIGLGEDGPTHQPIEQLPSLRAIPGLLDLRPGDANEVVEAWKVIMQLQHKEALLILTRQAVAHTRPHEICVRGRGCEGGLYSGRCSRWQAGSDFDCTRQRAFTLCRRVRTTKDGRDQSSRGQHAIVGNVSSIRVKSTGRACSRRR